MRKSFILLTVAMLLFSCGKSKGEQMLYDYQQKNVKSLNFDLADMNFSINKIEKMSDINASDSLPIIKKEFAEYWNKNPEQSLIDTLSFDYVKKVLTKSIAHQDTMQKLYQEAVLTAIRISDYSYKYESEDKRDKALEKLTDYKIVLNRVNKLEKYYTALSEKPDSILTSKYIANYSINNPMLSNVRQTFDKVLYTNPEQTEFVKEEIIE
ncbi:hypothetical protein APS56_04080 [Pseudalgibacter alginicilyticus]|uniref:Uncharacterized protein n=1 Tax=Pseudalgibacter alginicilyticus TaxID=1736674 RepID=A0A0N7HY62_9FLAO|nr:hypothetical protein [Pseudalgibacter alginicilyticus]ALJ04366.1 hypothetical protein APS56_04080 [Pseudalgibacter alginicilyticus]